MATISTAMADGESFAKKKILSSVKPTDFVGSENVLIATAGYGTDRATYNETAVDNAKVIGLMQSFNMDQMRQSPTVFEIGSAGKYVVHSNRVGGSLSMSKLVYSGANLLASLYPFADATTDKMKAAYGKYWLLNLADDLFANPIGLVVMFRDAAYNIAAGAFFENVMIGSHGLGISANNPMMGENVSLTYERVIPMFTHETVISKTPSVD